MEFVGEFRGDKYWVREAKVDDDSGVTHRRRTQCPSGACQESRNGSSWPDQLEQLSEIYGKYFNHCCRIFHLSLFGQLVLGQLMNVESLIIGRWFPKIISPTSDLFLLTSKIPQKRNFIICKNRSFFNILWFSELIKKVTNTWFSHEDKLVTHGQSSADIQVRKRMWCFSHFSGS